MKEDSVVERLEQPGDLIIRIFHRHDNELGLQIERVNEVVKEITSEVIHEEGI